MRPHEKLSALKASHPFLAAYLKADPNPSIESAPQGKMIVQEGARAEHSMLLLEGWVALSKSLPDGDIQILDIILPGDFILIGTVNSPVSPYSVEALGDALFINIHPPHVNGPTPELVRLRELMAAEIVHSQSRSAEMLLRVGKGSAASRIAFALIGLYLRLKAIGQADVPRFAFPITQQKVGEFTGLSNVHVCRIMRRLERDGIISHPNTTDIILNDLPKLIEIAGVDLETLEREILVQQD